MPTSSAGERQSQSGGGGSVSERIARDLVMFANEYDGGAENKDNIDLVYGSMTFSQQRGETMPDPRGGVSQLRMPPEIPTIQQLIDRASEVTGEQGRDIETVHLSSLPDTDGFADVWLEVRRPGINKRTGMQNDAVIETRIKVINTTAQERAEVAKTRGNLRDGRRV